MNDSDIDVRFEQIASLRRLESSAKLKHFPAIVCFSILNRSFVKFALDIPSGIQGLETPWRNRLENDAVALPSRSDVVQEFSKGKSTS